jgi:hypothetical protein
MTAIKGSVRLPDPGVTPRHYVVTVDSYLDTYVYQFASVDLAPGQEAYVKVLSMQQDKASDETGFARDIFYTRIIPADTARAAAVPRRFYGGS